MAETEDSPQTRQEEFYDRLAISEVEYTAVLDRALTHATAARPPADVAPVHHWIPIGPRSIGGRIRALVQHPTRPLTLYAGSAFGGVWRTMDGGDTWEPLSPPDQALPVSALGVSAQDPDVLYVGTGDAVDYYVSGRGLFRYDPTVAEPTHRFFQLRAPDLPMPAPSAATAGAAHRFTRIAVDPDDGNRFWAASPTGLWRCDVTPPVAAAPPAVPAAVPPSGAFVLEFPPAAPIASVPGEPALAAPPPLSANVPGAANPAGGLFRQVPYASDVLVVPDTRSALTVPIRGRAAPRYLLVYVGISGQGVYRGRYDRGAGPPHVMEWRARLPVPTPATFSRVLVAACRNHPEHLYAVVAEGDTASQLYYSSDRGDTWEARSRLPTSGQATYSMVLFVHPENPQVVVLGTVDTFFSSDGGKSWSFLLEWVQYYRGDRAQHADQHQGFFDRFDPRRIWLANDGGISAADLRREPAGRGFWRKRSHGIAATQFQDVTVHPTFPWMIGGGLQDNGSYLSYGGQSWYHVDGGDGGSVSFDPTDPRRFYGSTAAGAGGNMWRLDVVSATAPVTYFDYVTPVMPETPVPSGVYKVATLKINPDGDTDLGLFTGIHAHHPVRAGHLLVARRRAAWLTINGGGAWTRLTAGPFSDPNASVSAVAYSPGAPDDEWWIGTSHGSVGGSRTPGELFRTTNGSVALAAVPANPAWADMTPRAAPVAPAVLGFPQWRWGSITSIAFDSTRTRDGAGRPGRVAVALSGAGGPGLGFAGGQVWLWDARWTGNGWLDITGAALRGLPPCPITSVAFDPRDASVLYAGTLAGVYVCIGLPPAPPGPPAAAIAAPAFAGHWTPFNTGMPLLLVNDLHVLRDPTSAAPASLLRCATYGRGMFECHLRPSPVGAWVDPETVLYVRQHPIDDGLHPRMPLAALNAAPTQGDPRVPAGTLPFDLVSGYDIRVDAPPYTWLEDTVDPVEFDEDLGSDALVPGEVNFVYVQVHNRGWGTAAGTEVHLFFAHLPVPAPGTPPVVPDLPAAAAWAGFPADPVPAPWVRVLPRLPGGAGPAPPFASVDLRPGEPRVVRFDFVPPAEVAGRRVALLAVVRRGADAPPALPAAATPTAAYLVGTRHASLRVAAAGAFFPLYVRDGVEDSGHSGDVAWGGRSPDIIVVAPPAAPPADPHAAFADRADPRAGDQLKGGADNTLYVRVHNPSRLPLEAEVSLFRAPADHEAFKHARWTAVPPVTPVAARPTRTLVAVPAGDYALAAFRFTPADPDPAPADDPARPAYRAYLLVALVHHPAASPLPDPAGVDEVGKFWTLVRSSLAAKRAATRALRWIP